MSSFLSPEHKAKAPEKRKLAKNPFKPPTPKGRGTKQVNSSNQPTLNFFPSRTKSSLGLNLSQERKSPLHSASDSDLNKQNVPITVKSQSLSLHRSKSTLTTVGANDSFDDSFDDDVIEIKSQPANLKNSKPIGSIIPPMRKSASASPTSYPAPSVSSPSISGPNPSLSTSSSSLVSKDISYNSSFKPPAVKLNQLAQKGKNGQSTFTSFGAPPSQSSQSKKRSIDAFSLPTISARAKNPRLKEVKSQISKIPYSTSGIQFSDEQKRVLDLVIKDKKSIFYTGSAGTGKSVLLREIVQRLYRLHGVNAVAVTASTGLAAVNIGGVTINKFSGIGIGQGRESDLIGRVKRNPESRERWKRTKVLIVDEISMLDGAFLDKLEVVARNIRNINKPFGGIQLVLTGDFFQLPPVEKRDGPQVKFCFESKSWKTCINHTILLKEVFRQSDPTFVNLLNAVRVAEVNDEISGEFRKLSRCVEYEDGIQPTELFSTRYEVDTSNQRRLRELPGDDVIFVAKDTGKDHMLKNLENTMAMKKLILKEDAQVMMLKNINENVVNGSVGRVLAFLSSAVFESFKSRFNEHQIASDDAIREMRMLGKCYGQVTVPSEVLSFAHTVSRSEEFLKLAKRVITDPDEALPIVQFTTGAEPQIICVQRVDFMTDSGDEKIECSRSQIPLLLSWALSIHKSQGQTLDRVKVDLSKVFEAGQVYVALSRAVSKERLQIINFRHERITTNPRAKHFYKTLETMPAP